MHSSEKKTIEGESLGDHTSSNSQSVFIREVESLVAEPNATDKILAEEME